MSNKKKGERREQQAANIYGDAGYAVERCTNTAYDASDWFGYLDIMAVAPGDHIRFAQVKSNEASGVRGWFADVRALMPHHVRLDFLVCHDREGWRLLRSADDDRRYVTVLDERKQTAPMGASLADYLAAEVDG